MDLVSLVLLVAAFLGSLAGIRIIPEAQRIVVLRLGRFYGILEPGLRYVLPGLDTTLRVDLNRSVPEWQSLPATELHERLRQLAISGQLVTISE